MDCQEIKNIIPRYFQHTASEEEVKAVEEHLCVCHECRLALGELMDKMEEAAKPSEPQDGEEDIRIIPESGGESLEDAVESEKARNVNDKDVAGPDEAAGKIGEEEQEKRDEGQAEELIQENEPRAPSHESRREPSAEAESKEDIEYISGENIEDISEKEEKAASPQDASIEEEIKPFFEEKNEASQNAPAQEGGLPEPEPKEAGDINEKDIAGPDEAAGEIGEEPVSQEGDIRQATDEERKEEDTASDFPEKFSLEGENKAGLLEYGSLLVGLGILGFFVYLLLRG